MVPAGHGRWPTRLATACPAEPVRDTPAARVEWEKHVHEVTDQPLEVMQHAWAIFQQVYSLRGAVSGNKAKALVLVSLLYSNRLLHGSNVRNEEYLVRHLAITIKPSLTKCASVSEGLITTRSMNKAFTQMASVPRLRGRTSAAHPAIGTQNRPLR